MPARKSPLLSVLLFSVVLLTPQTLFAQQKYALVIGNSNYSGISRLTNPVNDANDMEAALKGLGFTVEKVLNGSLEQMERAVQNLSGRLAASRNSYGFFFYAGHGVQANGENYLIPIQANNIQNETNLRQRAVSLQFVLESLSEAGNELNMIVLDACRDNPFGWSRSGSRGLTVVSRAPSGSIVMYATGANAVADDGTGRNGIFTGQLLNNLKTQGLSVFEVFDKTMGDVGKVTNGKQQPELSLRYSGAASAYLGQRPAPQTFLQGLEYTIDDASVTITKYTGSAATLDIPAQIQGLPVTAIGDLAFFDSKNLTSVNIPSSVMEIGLAAFYNGSLTSITVERSNPAFTNIDGVLFDKDIETLIMYPAGKTARTYTIPSTVTLIGNFAFFLCTNLTDVTISPSVAIIGMSAFSGCRGLTSVTIPSSVIVVFPTAFKDCTGLTSVTIPASVGYIGSGAFEGCSSLANVTIPASVTSIGDEAFKGCNLFLRVSLSRQTELGKGVFPLFARRTYID